MITDNPTRGMTQQSEYLWSLWSSPPREHHSSIQDSGKGISPDDQKKVFNEFETLGKVAQHHKGTGLGMPISKRLIEGMGGEIHLESEVGVGSTFKIKVPINKVLEDTNYRDRPDEAGDLVA